MQVQGDDSSGAALQRMQQALQEMQRSGVLTTTVVSHLQHVMSGEAHRLSGCYEPFPLPKFYLPCRRETYRPLASVCLALVQAVLLALLARCSTGTPPTCKPCFNHLLYCANGNPALRSEGSPPGLSQRNIKPETWIAALVCTLQLQAAL